MDTWWEDLRDPISRTARARATLRKQPSAFLLALQVLVILMLPFLESSDTGRVALSLIGLLGLVVAVFTVRSTPALTWLSITLALPAAALQLWTLTDEQGLPLAVTHLALAVFYAYTGYALIAYMFEDAWVTPDELFAVGACFTVLVFAFAYAYLFVQNLWPGSFTAFDGEGQRSLLEMVYFSTANLTSVGLSDVLAVQPVARSVTIIEQLVGVMYVAMVISRLVALTVMRAHR